MREGLADITVVYRKYTSPFAILALVQNAGGGGGGGAYTRDVTISLAITPSLPVPVKHDLIVGGGWGPSARRTDAPDATGRLTSFSVEGQRSRALSRSSWRVHR